jgi:uncharacterized protein (TIGR02996 family)
MKPSAREERFERALVADPYDVAAWSAYADYLSKRGDPRGEFMRVQGALEDENVSAAERKKLRNREKALLEAHEREWVGDWADLVPAPTETESPYSGQVNHTGGRRYEFKRGLLTTVNFGALTVAAARAFVKAPETRFVRELFVGHVPYDDAYEPGPDVPKRARARRAAPLYVLLRWPRLRQVRRFQFGWAADDNYPAHPGFNCHLSGDLVFEVVEQMPDVEELRIFAHLHRAKRLFALPMPRLRVLQLYHGLSYPLEELAKNPSLTNLTHLLCHPHALDQRDSPYIRHTQLRAVCRSPYLKALTHLRLRLTDFGDFGAKELVESGILKRLKVLDLRHGCMSNDGAKLLAACPDLRNLEHIALSHNALTTAGANALRATKVPVELGHQHRDFVGDASSLYLYQGDLE